MICKIRHYTSQGRETAVTAADNQHQDGLVFITNIKSTRTQTCCYPMIIHTVEYKHNIWMFWSCLWHIPADPQYGSQENVGQGPCSVWMQALGFGGQESSVLWACAMPFQLAREKAGCVLFPSTHVATKASEF